MNTKPDYRAICKAAREKLAEQKLTEGLQTGQETFETFSTPEAVIERLREAKKSQ